MSGPDVALALRQPWVSIDNDWPGTSPDGLPRILRKYVREEHQLTLEEAVRKFSALPAQRMRLADRGALKRGIWADVVIFDPARVRDPATFEKPSQLSAGMEYVLVNGAAVIDHDLMTGRRPGKVLRGARYRVRHDGG